MEQTSQNLNRSAGPKFNTNDYPLVELSRNFHAPVERVWNAWITPELIKQWWGPENYSCPEAKVDFREGGKSVLAMQGPDGKIQYSGGTYQEIVPMKKIVTTDEFLDKNGKTMSANQAGLPGNWPETMVVTINFESLGDNESKINIIHEGIPKEVHDDCVSGWATSIDKLQKLVERS